jgi:Chaperone of endosialidase
MITNVSQAAGPTNVVNSEQKQFVFFGVGSSSQTSQTFTVDQQPFYLSAYNLGSDDVITVQQVYGQGSGTEVASFAPVNGAVTLNQSRTKVRIDHPGRYQLLHSGSSALGTFTVAGGAAVMTSDPIGDLAEALYQIFTTLSGNITVTAPITLTGGGTTQNPYVIGFEAGTVVGSNTITVEGSGTTVDPYVVSINATAPAGSAPPNFVQVQGATPITVTGNGTSATPYIVGLNTTPGGSPPDFVEIHANAPITIAGDGSAGNPYVVSATLASNPQMEALTSNAVAVTPGGLGHIMHVDTGSGGPGNTFGLSQNYSTSTGNNLWGFSITIHDSGSNNCAFGSGINISGNGYNIAIGTNSTCDSTGSLPDLTSACVAIGAGSYSVKGATVVGAYAGSSGLAGTSSVFGFEAGTMIDGGFSTAIGYKAGSVASHAGVYIGANAGIGETHTGIIIINDAGGGNLTATQNNQIVLGTGTQTQLVTAGSIIQGGAISASDERLKEHVEAESNALKTLNKLSPITFMWNQKAVKAANIPINDDEYGKLQHGFIAQEVEDHFPELVEMIDRGVGPYKFLRYERMISILVAAVQELSLEVESLKEKK